MRFGISKEDLPSFLSFLSLLVGRFINVLCMAVRIMTHGSFYVKCKSNTSSTHTLRTRTDHK
jgi:hypothetical protein